MVYNRPTPPSFSLPVLRPAQESEAEALSALARRTFQETFTLTTSEENLQAYIDRSFYPAKQLEEIRDPRRTIYIAWHAERAVGFFSLFEGEPEPCLKNLPAVELSRLYVESRWHGSGLARELMDLAIHLARQKAYASIWLGVWQENHRAQKFYRKMGFAKAGTHIFMMGDDAQTDDVLERILD